MFLLHSIIYNVCIIVTKRQKLLNKLKEISLSNNHILLECKR